ncbi:MAG: L-lactate dehydrogenase [Lactobacillus sp.]|jgi:L-lactate dehydrogenase|nr:L-lactate dehydrogenase [Lactobacillus sp.]
MTKVAIIGIGHVGSTVAYTLVARQLCDELVLLDQDKDLAEAEKQDLLTGQVGRTGAVAITASKPEELGSCDLIIFSAGDITILQNSTDRFAELTYTRTTVEQWAPIIKAANFKGVILNITNPCDVITQYMQQLTGFSKNRVLGTGTTLDTARMQLVVGNHFGVSPNAITGYVLGEHGNSQFVAWSGVRVGSEDITKLSDANTLAGFEDAAKADAWHTIKAKGYTSYGVADQAAIVAEAILKNSKLILPVTHYNEAVACYLGHPAIIGKAGIIASTELTLTPAEQQRWVQSANKIKDMFGTLFVAAS